MTALSVCTCFPRCAWTTTIKMEDLFQFLLVFVSVVLIYNGTASKELLQWNKYAGTDFDNSYELVAKFCGGHNCWSVGVTHYTP